MAAKSSVPSIVGAAENALRALLHKTLSPTPIRHYAQWVYLNAASSSRDAAWQRALDAYYARVEPG